MSDALVAALAGAVVGTILTGVTAYVQNLLSRESQKRTERERQRLALVREIMRYRLEQKRLIGPLNELPLVFGDDDEVLRLYRETLDASDDGARTRKLTDLINRLASSVGLPPEVRVSDIQRGFLHAE
ncbi:DUF6680 family protein [Sinomonas sp. B1-1]|uniref:DUF6680 family protein n=1 Tax=Sinomonas sp. B1-1 TaxID=3141454 RepID=UPI003D2C2E90